MKRGGRAFPELGLTANRALGLEGDATPLLALE